MKRYIFIIAALTALIFTGCSNDDDRPVKTPIDPLTDIYGVVTDNQGNRLQGIVVSDGYTCTATDENGVYQLTAGEFSYQVYLSIPAAYEVPMSEGLPCFWQKLTEGRKRYDFTLTPLAGGAENEFNLFCVADPQCQNTTNIARFNNETVPDIAAQRNFEYIFGPVNYSFDRGNVHIVAMDNIIFPSHKDYSLGFRDDQVEWLRQDLSYVSKDKMVIFCVHIPMRASNNQNVQAVLELLKPFAEVHIMSGHTHYAENNTYDSHYEHVHGAACGAWWHSTINTDGTPNGYAIYKVKGATIDNWVYKATGFDPDFQIRLYRGSDIFMEGYTPSYQFYYKGDDQIVANIWNADKDWKIEVYENGTKTGEMKPYESNATKRDAWASGYHCGVQGRAPSNYDRTNTSHLYYYTLQSSTASVEVRATDKFGQTYSQSKFTTGLAEDFPVGE